VLRKKRFVGFYVALRKEELEVLRHACLLDKISSMFVRAQRRGRLNYCEPVVKSVRKHATLDVMAIAFTINGYLSHVLFDNPLQIAHQCFLTISLS